MINNYNVLKLMQHPKNKRDKMKRNRKIKGRNEKRKGEREKKREKSP